MNDKLKEVEKNLQQKFNTGDRLYLVKSKGLVKSNIGTLYELYKASYKRDPEVDYKVWERQTDDCVLAFDPNSEEIKYMKCIDNSRQGNTIVINAAPIIKLATEEDFNLAVKKVIDESIEDYNNAFHKRAMEQQAGEKLKKIPLGNNNPALGCNMNVKLRIGGRKAPLGGADHLTYEAIFKYLGIDLSNPEYDYDNKLDGVAYALVYSEEAEKKKLYKDFKYNVDGENCGFDHEGTTASGVDYLAFWKGGDWEIPAGFFLYWDGKDLRVYEPLKGNCINTINKSAFGNGHEIEDGEPDADEAYCLKEFGQSFDEDVLKLNWGAMEEDFNSRLEIIK